MRIFLHFTALFIILFSSTACGSENGNETTESPNDQNEIQENHDTGNNNAANEDNVGEPDNHENKDNADHENQTENDSNEQSQAELISDIAEQEVTSFSFHLPTQLPVDDTKHLTGKTESEEGSINIIFYQTNEKTPPNDQHLEDEHAEKIAQLHIKQYDSEQAAEEEISFENFAESGGNEVDLDYDLTGYQDAGAGSALTNWNEGRWAFSTRTTTDHSDQGVQFAKEVVNYLETNALPAPQAYGSGQFDIDNKDYLVKWQDGDTVYTIDQVKEPLDTLKIAASFD